MVCEPEREQSDDERVTDTFTRRETPQQRRARISKRAVDPKQADAIRRALGTEAQMETQIDVRLLADVLTFVEDVASTGYCRCGGHDESEGEVCHVCKADALLARLKGAK